METAPIVSRILCLDVGSSSVKFALYDIDGTREHAILTRTLESGDATQLAQACDTIAREIERTGIDVDAAGHRVVYGGTRAAPALATSEELDALKEFVPLDPLHQAPQLAVVDAMQRRYRVPHVLCFDSAFFHDLPELAKRLPLPDTNDPLLRRYGFHGLSYEYVASELGGALRGNAIVAHLGNGASMCALRDGKPLETTMGFSPLGGFMMGTRPGDLDPGIMLYLLDKGYTRERLTEMLYRQSGLLGVSGISSDMRTLLARAATDERAAFALELFLYQLARHVGALIAVLGGLDTLAFTGGIGENAAAVRDRLVEKLSFLGSQPVVRVIRTNENLMIARHVVQFLHANFSKGA